MWTEILIARPLDFRWTCLNVMASVLSGYTSRTCVRSRWPRYRRPWQMCVDNQGLDFVGQDSILAARETHTRHSRYTCRQAVECRPRSNFDVHEELHIKLAISPSRDRGTRHRVIGYRPRFTLRYPQTLSYESPYPSLADRVLPQIRTLAATETPA